ncbi:glycosyltransferase family 4 protein [Specibacter sp. NPDC057265]|uniref:glycosyltransferase family 4 protein n=1 Tax=Specibacter sp. NPDC057265 TaxID=3346075 RepID=UPI003627B1FF
MKILVYPHDLAIGGSQLNAIELAAAVQGLGHEVLVYGQPGPLVDRIQELGLEFIASPAVHRRPTPGVVAQLHKTIRERSVDVVHAYEWPPALEAALACAASSRATAVATVMSMSVAPFIPRHLPLLVGTGQIAAVERDTGRTRVGLLEPHVDTVLNSAGAAVDTPGFLRGIGAEPGMFTVSIVSRLAHEMKLEGILSAIAAVEAMNRDAAVQLVIAGTGPAREEVAACALRSNAALGVPRIFLVGELSDPRPAYASANVSIGMGASALRAMAFGLPLVVQGENGFWGLLDEEAAPQFLWQGWYGSGPGPGDAVQRLQGILTRLQRNGPLRTELGRFSRRLVVERFSLERAARLQLDFYQGLQDHPPLGGARRLAAAGVAAWQFALHQGQQIKAARAGGAAVDDFNSTAVLARTPVGTAPEGH